MSEYTGPEMATDATLRDYFAAKAMQADIMNPHRKQGMSFSDFAKRAYEQADAMLKERSK